MKCLVDLAAAPPFAVACGMTAIVPDGLFARIAVPAVSRCRSGLAAGHSGTVNPGDDDEDEDDDEDDKGTDGGNIEPDDDEGYDDEDDDDDDEEPLWARPPDGRTPSHVRARQAPVTVGGWVAMLRRTNADRSAVGDAVIP